MNARLGATRDDHVGPSEPDQVKPHRDRLRTGGAGTDRGVRAAPGAQFDAFRTPEASST